MGDDDAVGAVADAPAAPARAGGRRHAPPPPPHDDAPGGGAAGQRPARPHDAPAVPGEPRGAGDGAEAGAVARRLPADGRARGRPRTADPRERRPRDQRRRADPVLVRDFTALGEALRTGALDAAGEYFWRQVMRISLDRADACLRSSSPKE